MTCMYVMWVAGQIAQIDITPTLIKIVPTLKKEEKISYWFCQQHSAKE